MKLSEQVERRFIERITLKINLQCVLRTDKRTHAQTLPDNKEEKETETETDNYYYYSGPDLGGAGARAPGLPPNPSIFQVHVC